MDRSSAILELHHQGYNTSEIALKLGVSYDTIWLAKKSLNVIYDLDYTYKRLLRHVVKTSLDCWELHGIGYVDEKGYTRFKIKSQTVKSYRFFYERYNGQIPKDRMCCHRCNNPRCVNPAHLYAGTATDNMRDMVNAGRSSLGKILGSRKLSKEAQEEAIMLKKEGKTAEFIANHFGVGQTTICRLIARHEKSTGEKIPKQTTGRPVNCVKGLETLTFNTTIAASKYFKCDPSAAHNAIAANCKLKGYTINYA
jgi:transposase